MTRVVFMGTPDFAVPSLASLLREGYDLVGVFTREDSPVGRGQHVEESAVKKLARAEGLSVYQPRSLRGQVEQDLLKDLSPEVIVVAAYGLILPQAVLDLPRFGCVNVHGSLLPRHRGAAPVAAAILAGDPESGISIMLMDAGVDTGPVLSMASLPIEPEDTTGGLTARLASLGADLLTDTLPLWLRGEIAPQPQSEAGATFAPRIEKEAGQINWSEPAGLIERRVRAYHPWPSAYTTWKGQRVKILRAQLAESHGVGEVVGTDVGSVIAGDRDTAGVVTGSGILWLLEVQLAGKRALPIDAFLRGSAGFMGSQLGEEPPPP